MPSRLLPIILALAVLLAGGCGGSSQPPAAPSAPAGNDAFVPSPPPSCAVSPPAPGSEFGTDSGAVHLSWPPVLSWNGPGISPVILGVEPDPSQVRITARHLEGDANAIFAGFGAGDSPVSELVLPGPFIDGEDLFGYITLPEPGCWRFEFDVDGEKQSIAVYAYGEVPPADCPVTKPMEVRPDIAPGLGEG